MDVDPGYVDRVTRPQIHTALAGWVRVIRSTKAGVHTVGVRTEALGQLKRSEAVRGVVSNVPPH